MLGLAEPRLQKLTTATGSSDDVTKSQELTSGRLKHKKRPLIPLNQRPLYFHCRLTVLLGSGTNLRIRLHRRRHGFRVVELHLRRFDDRQGRYH